MWSIYIPAALSLAVLAMLVRSSLWRLVPFFTLSLLVRLAETAAATGVSSKSAQYFRIWFVGESLLLVAVGLAVVEIYLHFNRAIYRAGRTGAILVVGAVVAGAVTAVWTTPVASAEWNARAAGLLAAKRMLLTVFSGALAAVLLFYRRFPVPVASYVWPHAALLLAHSASHAFLAWSTEWLGSRGLAALNQLLVVAASACLAGWLWVFSKPVTWPRPPSDTEILAAEAGARRLAQIMDSRQ